MNVLLIHQNYPGQFKHLGPALVQQGHRVLALPMSQQALEPLNGVTRAAYYPSRSSTQGVHPWVADFETKTIRAEAAFLAAKKLKAQGYEPEVILAHPGWGESLFLKDVWPKARLGIYCEFYYAASGSDVGFDPEFYQVQDTDICRIQLKNLNNLLHFERADAGLSPTHWQASTFPAPFRDRITVVHDGIDTDRLQPNPAASIKLNLPAGELQLTRSDEVVTFVNRNLEPYRGFHVFMRSLPRLLAHRPQAKVLIIGGDGVGYGAASQDGKTWRQRMVEEVRPQLTESQWSRVHFLGNVSYEAFVGVMQVSTVHVYLTYPFVLSWSLLEAMSLGCTIVASKTAPLLEAIEHGHTGRLVDFFDATALADEVASLLDDPSERARLAVNARALAVERYDLQRVCLPKQLEWVRALAAV